MKITKFYSLIVNGDVIFTGSEGQCKMVFDAVMVLSRNLYASFGKPIIDSALIAYTPAGSSFPVDDQQINLGGFSNVKKNEKKA